LIFDARGATSCGVSDEELLRKAKAGDVEPLLETWEPRLYRFGLRMCGDEDTAREVLQETLLAAFKGIGGFRGEAELSTWLYSVARSFCIRQRRRPTGEELSVRQPDESPAPDAATHARELGRVLQAALLSLEPEQREVVVLKDVEGLKAEQIADVLGIGVAAVKSRLHRARLELRGRLTSVLEPSGGSVACPELSEELAAYVGGDIDQATCHAIEAHLAKCPRCGGACEALKRTVSLCQQLPDGEVPAPVRAAVRRAIKV
jgi:RNA polymerase sigma-70 factor (ECF subfamily)